MYEGLKYQEKSRKLRRFIAISGLMVNLLVGCNLEATKKPPITPPAPPSTVPEMPTPEAGVNLRDQQTQLGGYERLELPAENYHHLSFTLRQKDLNRLQDGRTLEVRLNGFRFVISADQVSVFAENAQTGIRSLAQNFRVTPEGSGDFAFDFGQYHNQYEWDVSLVINGGTPVTLPQTAPLVASVYIDTSLQLNAPGTIVLSDLTINR